MRKVLTALAFLPPHQLSFLMDPLRCVLTDNNCTFENVIYHQLKGTAMGTPAAVGVPMHTFLYGIEKTILLKCGYSFYSRYIDDVFGIYHFPVVFL